MKKFTLKQVEDYLTNRISGITVIDVSIEFPAKQAAFQIEGEYVYYLFEDQNGVYSLTDGKQETKVVEEPEQTEAQFLNEVIRIILDEA
ncbi:hypothetical protein [Enterococcus sp. AZ103]|uniref:hypothetical protein n=1 Tax=Enterococcus sp. AZ103 TaxID=2774628 RepID=UPI003F1E6D2C